MRLTYFRSVSFLFSCCCFDAVVGDVVADDAVVDALAVVAVADVATATYVAAATAADIVVVVAHDDLVGDATIMPLLLLLLQYIFEFAG